MARAAFRPRTTKNEQPKKSGSPSKPRKTGKLRKAGSPGKTATPDKDSKPSKTGKSDKPSNPGKPKETGHTGAGSRRPLPLPLRLLATLCAFAFMVAFAVVLAHLTLQPSPASVSMAHTNLHPGHTLKAYLDQPALRDAVKQIGGNLLLGVPFGVLVPVVAPGARGVLRVLALTAIVMLLVEMAQGALVTGRAFDVDDVILNTSGALVGYLLLGHRMGRAVHEREKRR